jgi:hypothetical protein
MSNKVIRHCKFCNAEMKTERSTMKLCSKGCHSAYARWRYGIGVTNKQGYQVIDDLLTAGYHPNPFHQINIDNPDHYKTMEAALRLVKAERALQEAKNQVEKLDDSQGIVHKLLEILKP